MSYELPKEFKDKTPGEILESLSGKRIRGKYIRDDHEVRVLPDLDKQGCVSLALVKPDGKPGRATVKLVEVKRWLETCEFSGAE